MYYNQFCKTMEQIGKQLAACNRKFITALSKGECLSAQKRKGMSLPELCSETLHVHVLIQKEMEL